jgi:hypothetical protein
MMSTMRRLLVAEGGKLDAGRDQKRRYACDGFNCGRAGKRGLLLLLMLAATASLPALADDAETQALRREVEELKQRVKSLEAQHAPAVVPSDQASRAASAPTPASGAAPAATAAPPPAVSASHAESATAVAPASVSAPPAQPGARPLAAGQAPPRDSVAALRLSWRQVSRGMSETQILDTLGKPSGETRINGKRVWYYYYPGIGGGSVFFNSDGRVSSNQPPNVGFW